MLEHRPVVVLLPFDRLGDVRAPDDDQGLSRLIERCWAQSCLPFTVVSLSEARLPPVGVLAVHVDDAPDAQEPPELPARSQYTIVFPRAHAAGTPLALSDSLATAGYVAVAAAALPGEPPCGHLERTARLVFTGPTYARPGRAEGRFQLLDLDRALRPGDVRLHFGPTQFRWDDAVEAAGDGAPAVSDADPGLQEKKRRVIVAMPGRVKMRWLSAASVLTYSTPVLFAPTKLQGIAVLQPRSHELDPSADADLFRMLRTQQVGFSASPDEFLFNVVSREFQRN